MGSKGSPTVKFSAALTASSSTSASLSRGTIIRVSALHVCPEFMKAFMRPSGTALARSVPSRKTLALLPPSSSATRFTVSEASSATRFPAFVEPVKLTIATSGWEAMASPTTGPTPEMRLNTPGGRPVLSMISARMKALSGATSLGLRTTVQPAANAGATLAAIW